MCFSLRHHIVTLHDLSCQPEDVQNYIDRSLLLTHGFVPIIEASHVQQGHDWHELILIIEMLLDVICTYVIIHVVLRGSTFHTYCFCVFLSHLLWLNFTFVFFLASFHTCPFNIRYSNNSSTHWNPSVATMTLHHSPDIFWHRCAEHLSLSWWQQSSFVWISVGVWAFWWICVFSFAQQQTNAKEEGEQGTRQPMVELSFKHSHSYFNYHTYITNEWVASLKQKHLKSRDYDDYGNVFAGSGSFLEHWFCRLAHSLHLGLGRVKERILHSLRMPCQVKEHGPLKVEISLLDCYFKRPLCRSWFADVNILRKSNVSFTSICKIYVTQEAVGGGGAVGAGSSNGEKRFLNKWCHKDVHRISYKLEILLQILYKLFVSAFHQFSLVEICKITILWKFFRSHYSNSRSAGTRWW